MPHISWLVLCSTVNYTTTFSRFCLWALCPSCALLASLKGFLSSNTHVMVVFTRAGNEECKFSRDIAGNSLPKELDFLLPTRPWRAPLTPVTTPAAKSSPEVTKQGLNSGNSCNFIIFQFFYISGTENIHFTAKILLEEKSK